MSRPSAEMIPAVTEPPEPERIAYRDYPISDLGVIAVPPCHVGKLLAGIDLEKGDVGLLVAANHFGRVPAVILKEYRHLVGVATTWLLVTM